MWQEEKSAYMGYCSINLFDLCFDIFLMSEGRGIQYEIRFTLMLKRSMIPLM